MMTEKAKKYVIEHYPNEYAKDIAEVLGVSINAVRLCAIRNGVRKTDDFWIKSNKYCNECGSRGLRRVNYAKTRENARKLGRRQVELGLCFKKGVTRAMMIGDEREKLCREKIGKRTRAIIARDRMRIDAGLAPASKRKYSPYSKKRQKLASEARRRLVTYNGYIVERGGNVFFYDDNTRRSEIMEKRGADRYGFKFLRVGCDVEKNDVKAEWKYNGDDFNRFFNFT